MKKVLLSTLIAALPSVALADGKSDEIAKLKAQLQALQSQVQQLQKAVEAASETGKEAQAKAEARAESDQELKQSVASMELKVDKLNTAANEGPIAGLSITGYLDPSYIYNRAPNSAGFQFVNHQAGYNYYNSTFGDVYLDIKKTFGVGPTAPSAEITILPNRGNGNILISDNGQSTNNNIINTAVITFPLSDTWQLTAGLMNSFGGYEVQQSNQMQTLTHGLLYDFSDPGSYVGAGFNWSHGAWAWKFLVGNEQFHTHANIQPYQGTRSNNTPSVTARVDYTWSSLLDLGFSANAGRQTTPTTSASTGNGPYSNYFFAEADAAYTLPDGVYNAELDYGQQQRAAWNGGDAVWYGLSLLANQRWGTETLGRMGATLRYDYLHNSKNGGGGGGIALSNGTDSNNGFGVSPACVSASSVSGMDCKGANRQALTADLLFYPTDQLTLKFEYRHDWASENVFLKNDGSYKKSNDMLGAQAVYTF